MNDHTPLLDRLDQTPVALAPLGELLAAGRAAKRRQRRAVIVGAAAATMLVLGGGGAVVAQSLAAGSTASVSPADGVLTAEELTVRVTSGVPSFANVPVGQPLSSGVRAKWDPDARTLTYVSDVGYSSSCLPTATATITTDGTVALTIIDNLGAPGLGCTADAVRVAAVMKSISLAPTTLYVTHRGITQEVPFLMVGPGLIEQFSDDAPSCGAPRGSAGGKNQTLEAECH